MNQLKKPKRRVKARVLFLIKLSMSLSLLAYLFSLVGFQSLLISLKDIIPVYIAIAFFLLLGQSLLSALKWRTLLVADGIRLRYLYLLKIYFIGNFVSLFLPTSFGGDVYRVMAVRKSARSTAKTTSSVLFDRLTGLFALLSIAGLAYLAYPGLPLKRFVVLGYTVGLLIFWLGTSGWTVRRCAAVQNDLARKLVSILASFNTYAKNGRCLFMVLAVSFAFQLNIVVINKIYSMAFGLEVPFTTLLVIIPLVYLTEVIPLSINGLGFREGAFVFFYQLIGQSAEAGFAISLLVLTIRYTMGLIGGILFVVNVISDRGKAPNHDIEPVQ